MRTLHLDILKKGLPGIITVMGAYSYYCEAAIVSLMKSGHQSGVVLKVEGDFEISFTIKWDTEVDKTTLNSWKEEKVYCSYGAVGIGLCLALELLGYDTFEEGRQGTGIDFWLSKAGRIAQTIAFSKREARLELSGITREKPGNTINARITRKKDQIAASDHTLLPGWIIVTEFFSPKSKIIKK